MQYRATTIVVFLALLLSAKAQQPSDLPVLEIVAQSQRALDKHEQKEALRLVQEGLQRFPGDEALQLQLARVHVYAKHDHEAMDVLNAVLKANPSSRNAKIALAQLYGYRENYQKSDAIYRELLAARPNDETAALGLVRNLALEGKRDEARQQLQEALKRNPGSLELQQFNDVLGAAKGPVAEGRPETHHRVQAGESFFSDSSGNRALYSAQGFFYEITPKIFSRTRVDETSLWKTATPARSMISATNEVRVRLNKYLGLRASGGVVRFSDATTRPLYSGDLDIYPWKNLLLSGGYTRFPIVPTFDAEGFDLLSEGWHSRLDYRTRNFTLDGAIHMGHYSDGNRFERETGEVMRWVGPQNWSVGGGYAFRHLHFQQQLTNGYFSPSQYRSHLGAGGLRVHVGRIYRGEFLGYLGVEQINQGSFTAAGEVLLRNEFFIRRWEIEANYSHYQLVQSTAAFSANMVSGSLGYRF